MVFLSSPPAITTRPESSLAQPATSLLWFRRGPLVHSSVSKSIVKVVYPLSAQELSLFPPPNLKLHILSFHLMGKKCEINFFEKGTCSMDIIYSEQTI